MNAQSYPRYALCADPCLKEVDIYGYAILSPIHSSRLAGVRSIILSMFHLGIGQAGSILAMLLLNTLSAVLALSSSALALPLVDGLEGVTFRSSIFEKLAKPPVGWQRDDRVQLNKEGSSVKLRIHLVQQNMRDFHDLALKVLHLANPLLRINGSAWRCCFLLALWHREFSCDEHGFEEKPAVK